MMNKLLTGTWQYITGNYRACEFALTNICVAQCSFCGIWKQQPKIRVNRQDALDTIDHLASLGIRFVTLTGGEPLLHPNIAELVERCTRRGVVTSVLDADPRLLTEKTVTELKEAKADFVCISIDHYTDEIEYQARKIPGLLDHISNAVGKLKRAKVRSVASVLISNFNHTELRPLMDKCVSLGFDYVSINYPEHSLSPVYELGGEMVTLTKMQIIRAIEDVISIKKLGYGIVNPVDSMQNIIRYLKDEPVDYLCLGGNRVLFVDWFLDVYPCMHLDQSMGNIFNLTENKLLAGKCNACNMSWYRDFSVYLQGARSIVPLFRVICETAKR
jgi:MoaA/NifB/PqqE/SkfB family radical SAM enzyme